MARGVVLVVVPVCGNPRSNVGSAWYLIGRIECVSKYAGECLRVEQVVLNHSAVEKFHATMGLAVDIRDFGVSTILSIEQKGD